MDKMTLDEAIEKVEKNFDRYEIGDDEVEISLSGSLVLGHSCREALGGAIKNIRDLIGEVGTFRVVQTLEYSNALRLIGIDENLWGEHDVELLKRIAIVEKLDRSDP